MDTKSNKRPREDPVANKKRLVSKTIIYDESKPNQWLDDPPLEIWDHVIIPMLGLKDLALSRHVCTFFEAYWQDKFSNNVLPLRVGNDVATIDRAMRVIEILSSRREYTKLNPCVVLLGKGDHEITSSWTDGGGEEISTILAIICSNITFVGEGIDTTTILGGFFIDNQENITFKNMTVTNLTNNGIRIEDSLVELVEVAITQCECGLSVTGGEDSKNKEQVVLTRCQFAQNEYGIFLHDHSNIKMTDCVSNNNKSDGLVAFGATINIHGEATAIHSNQRCGIRAYNSVKVVIHLPSHHNTIYNNGGQDRFTHSGGTITNVPS